ncbi:MAG TPA: hypothetical protein GXZ23_02975 [Clostridiales bacterium]|jgi:tRNA U54 and U55 pseudouridine synthase Pus10|nr:hypothetical protein [Clostridiales bacterium]
MGKYNFQETTIGDILDNEDAYAVFKELVPEAIDHPMLEVGRPFTVELALPFIRAIGEEMGVENIDDRVEKFEAALLAL